MAACKSVEVTPGMKAITTTNELAEILSQPDAFLFLHAVWSGPSVRGRQVLETDWWPKVQRALELRNPVFEIDIDSSLYKDTVWPIHIEPTKRILWNGVEPAMLGSGEFLWFAEGELVDVAIHTMSIGYDDLLRRTRSVLNREL